MVVVPGGIMRAGLAVQDGVIVGLSDDDALPQAREIIDARFERFLSTRPPLIRGALVDQGALDGIVDGSRLARRGGSICVIRVRGDRLIVLLGDRRLEMPAWLEPAMRRVAATPSFVVGDLADVLPDPAARAVLARRLVREGLLRPLP